MKKIILCVKLVKIINDDDSISYIVNPYDYCSINLAIVLKKRYNIPIIALTLGAKKHESALKELITYGIDEIVLVSDKNFIGSDTLVTSYILSKTIQRINDVLIVICGNKSYDGGTEQVPIELAEKLEFPILTHVLDVENIDYNQKIIYVKKQYSESNIGVFSSKLPCVMSINSNCYHQKLSKTISGILKMDNYIIKILSGEDLNIDYSCCGEMGSPTKVIKTERTRINSSQSKICFDNIHNSMQYLSEILNEKNKDK